MKLIASITKFSIVIRVSISYVNLRTVTGMRNYSYLSLDSCTWTPTLCAPQSGAAALVLIFLLFLYRFQMIEEIRDGFLILNFVIGAII